MPSGPRDSLTGGAEAHPQVAESPPVRDAEAARVFRHHGRVGLEPNPGLALGWHCQLVRLPRPEKQREKQLRRGR